MSSTTRVSSGKKSFLDDLLADDDISGIGFSTTKSSPSSSVTEVKKPSKTVRFSDHDDGVRTSSPPTKTSTPSVKVTKTKNWLGLDDDEPFGEDKNDNSITTSSTKRFDYGITSTSNIRKSTSTTSLTSPSRTFDEGGERRYSRELEPGQHLQQPSWLSTTATTSTPRDNGLPSPAPRKSISTPSISSISPSSSTTTSATTISIKAPNDFTLGRRDVSSSGMMMMIPSDMTTTTKGHSIVPSSSSGATVVSGDTGVAGGGNQPLDSSLLLLHTQVKALETEKTQLTLAIDKIRSDFENIHKSLVDKQEGLIKESNLNVDGWTKSLTTLKEELSFLKKELEEERERLQETQDSLIKEGEQSRASLQSQSESMIKERKELSADRRSFEREKEKTLKSLSEREDQLIDKEKQFEEERHQFEQDLSDFKSKLRDFQIRESDFKRETLKENHSINEEKQRLAEESLKLDYRSKELDSRQSRLSSLEQSIKEREMSLRLEKEKLLSLASQVKSRAGELELLSQLATSDREEGLSTLSTASALRSELEGQRKILQERQDSLLKREEALQEEGKRLQEEWARLKGSKDNLICSLCATTLSVAKARQSSIGGWPSTFNPLLDYGRSDYNMQGIATLLPAVVPLLPPPTDEQSLLVWQVSSQQESALVAEETAFLRRMTASGMTGGTTVATGSRKSSATGNPLGN